jgi:hypothetical protein
MLSKGIWVIKYFEGNSLAIFKTTRQLGASISYLVLLMKDVV